MKKTLNLILLLTLPVVLATVLSGCLQKEASEVTDATKEENKEIDTSDWLTYEDEKYGFEIKYPEEWGRLSEEFIDGSDILNNIHTEPKHLLLSFDKFPGQGEPRNNYIKFISKKSYNNLIKNNPSFNHQERYEVLKNIYNQKSIDHFNINNFNAGSAAYSLFREKPLISNYLESPDGKHRGIAYYSSGAYQDVYAVSHTYNVIIMNNKGDIIDMLFFLKNEFFDDLTKARNKKIDDDYAKNGNKIDYERVKDIADKWELKYKEKFNLLIVNDFLFKEIIGNIDLVVENINKIEKEIGEEIDTSSWNTYKNKKYGYQLKYPHGWKFLDGGKHFAIWEQDETAVNVQVQTTFPDLNTLPEKEKLTTIKEWYKDREIKNISIDGKTGIFFISHTLASPYVPTVLLPLEDYIWSMGIEFIPEEQEEYYTNLFKTFLYTIKFNQ